MIHLLILNMPFVAVLVILLTGLAAVVIKRSVIKVLMGVSLMESATNLFLVAIGYRHDGVAPIFTNAPSTHMVMPTVQALTLTSIVIGVATSAMMLSFVIILYRKYGTADIQKIRKLHG
ncbi:MAG: cation:proton antiporter subunit C [Lentisphaerota bacterium]